MDVDCSGDRKTVMDFGTQELSQVKEIKNRTPRQAVPGSAYRACARQVAFDGKITIPSSISVPAGTRKNSSGDFAVAFLQFLVDSQMLFPFPQPISLPAMIS